LPSYCVAMFVVLHGLEDRSGARRGFKQDGAAGGICERQVRRQAEMVVVSHTHWFFEHAYSLRHGASGDL
jgi:hypothetical protein